MKRVQRLSFLLVNSFISLILSLHLSSVLFDSVREIARIKKYYDLNFWDQSFSSINVWVLVFSLIFSFVYFRFLNQGFSGRKFKSILNSFLLLLALIITQGGICFFVSGNIDARMLPSYPVDAISLLLFEFILPVLIAIWLFTDISPPVTEWPLPDRLIARFLGGIYQLIAVVAFLLILFPGIKFRGFL